MFYGDPGSSGDGLTYICLMSRFDERLLVEPLSPAPAHAGCTA
jgi:hypothetical protein